MKVKICGITNLEDALFCAEAGADALGFIFYEKSKRYITPDDAEEIISRVPSLIMKVGVFVNEESGKVNETARQAGLTSVQLHGDEAPDYVEEITPPVIKAFRVDDNFDYTVLENYDVSRVLLDTYSKNEYGGTGEVFDWHFIPENIRGQIILAGGINSKNIKEIFTTIKPAMVDLSSALESSPGRKDKDKVMEFMNKIKEMRGY